MENDFLVRMSYKNRQFSYRARAQEPRPSNKNLYLLMGSMFLAGALYYGAQVYKASEEFRDSKAPTTTQSIDNIVENK